MLMGSLKLRKGRTFGVTPALRDARVPDDVVQVDVAARLHAVGCQQEGHARHVLHGVSPFAQNEALRTEAALVVKQEAKSCRRKSGESGG